MDIKFKKKNGEKFLVSMFTNGRLLIDLESDLFVDTSKGATEGIQLIAESQGELHCLTPREGLRCMRLVDRNMSKETAIRWLMEGKLIPAGALRREDSFEIAYNNGPTTFSTQKTNLVIH